MWSTEAVDVCAIAGVESYPLSATVNVFAALEEHKIFSSCAEPLPITITNGLIAPLGKVLPSITEMELEVLLMFAANCVFNTPPANSLLNKVTPNYAMVMLKSPDATLSISPESRVLFVDSVP